MLDSTGERFVPWAEGAAVAYEHLHRYIWAAGFVEGRKVLDLASGEGYGAELLARRASFVCGVDIDDDSISHASQRYRRPNLEFLKGSLTAVPVAEPQSFDVITCFEAIEHIEQHDDLMREVKRLLKPDGLFIVSTPNKDAYKTGTEPNPFHVKELTFAQFDALLSRHFSRIKYLGQGVYPSSSMWPLWPNAGFSIREYAVEKRRNEFQTITNDTRTVIYFVAIAFDLDAVDLCGSVLVDCSGEMVKERNRETAHFQEKLLQQEEALAWRAKQVEELQTGNGLLAAQLDLTKRELHAIHQTLGWRVLRKLRGIRARLTGQG